MPNEMHDSLGFEALEDQRPNRNMELGNLVKKYCMKVIRKACRQREELQGGERQHCQD